MDACSPIVPLIVGAEAAAVSASAALLARGLHVPAIRPPTVPVGTSRYNPTALVVLELELQTLARSENSDSEPSELIC